MDVSQRGEEVAGPRQEAPSGSVVHGPFKFSILRLTSGGKKDLSNFELEEAVLVPANCSSALLLPPLTVNGTTYKSDCLKSKLSGTHSVYQALYSV